MSSYTKGRQRFENVWGIVRKLRSDGMGREINRDSAAR